MPPFFTENDVRKMKVLKERKLSTDFRLSDARFKKNPMRLFKLLL